MPLGATSPLRSNPTRRHVLLAATLGLPWARAALAADAYPSRPIRFIIPFTAGSIGDLFMRQVTQQMSPRLGQPMVIDNKPGASQAIGGEIAARAAPDGYTIFFGSQSGLVLNAIARKKLPFDPVADFTPVAPLFAAPVYVYVGPSLAAKTIPELIAVAKARRGQLSYASIGPGTSSHLMGEMFKTMAGIDLLHVPFKGGPEATNALASGQVDVFFNGSNTMAQVKQGRAHVLASCGLKRTEEHPELPTVAESGLPGFQLVPWFGLFAPAGVPRTIVDRLNQEFALQLKSAPIREKSSQMGIEITIGTPEALGQQVRNELAQMAIVMRKAGVQAE